MAVAEWTGAVVDWRAELGALKARIAPALGRAETRASAGAFIDGLLGPAERKTGWMLAEQAGLERPHRIQSLLGLLPLVGRRAARPGSRLRGGGARG